MSVSLMVRRDDIWCFTTNNGHIHRHVRSVACGVVSYLCNGVFRQCSLSTFRKWAKGAELEYRSPDGRGE